MKQLTTVLLWMVLHQVVAAQCTAPDKPVITSSGPVIFNRGDSVTLTAPSGFITYRWSNGATTPSITVRTAGSYTAVVTNSNGCSSPVSDAVVVTLDSSPVIFVTDLGAGNRSGLNWANAISNSQIQSKLMNAVNGSQLWVKAGTYYPTEYPNGCSNCNNDRDKAFLLRNGVALYGGFAGTETELSQRNVIANPTVLSGDIGAPGNSGDNNYHIVISAGNDSTALLDGFTIAGGNANGYGTRYLMGRSIDQSNGAGIFCTASSPKISNCTITQNAGSSSGAGMINSNSAPVISNCTFSNNNSYNEGGGMANYSSSPVISRSKFISNTAASNGGGIYNGYSTLVITNSVFITNSSYAGGGIANYSAAATITNTAFSGNSSGYGGGIYNIYSSAVTITNNVFATNTSNSGGAIYNNSSSPVIVNSTFYTTATNGSRQLYNSNSNPTIINSIIWSKGGWGAGIDNQSSSTNITYSIVQNGWGGTGNSDADPLFTNPDNPAGADGIFGTGDDGLKLQANSPAINAGNNTAIPAGITTDITGMPRIRNQVVDLGSYETFVCPSYTKLYVDSSSTVSGDGSSWSMAYKELREALAVAAQCNRIDSILVAKGTYKPTADNRRDTAFALLRGGLKLYGGYTPGGGIRNILVNETILSGDIGMANDNTDNNYHVIVVAGLGNSADSLVLDGFTVTKGNANGGSAEKMYNGIGIKGEEGGGIMLYGNNGAGDKIAIRQCRLIANNAVVYGAGMYCQLSSPEVTNCSFQANRADRASGMFNYNQSNSTVTNCIFSQNQSSIDGGGALNYLSSPGFINCTFTANTAFYGGGMYNYINAETRIINCTFTADTAFYGGGMFNNYLSNPTVTRCLFTGNNSTYGGAIFVTTGAATRVDGCTFQRNYAISSGGAIETHNYSSLQLLNSNFIANYAGDYAGALLTDQNSVSTVTNSTFYGNYITTNNPFGGASYIANGSTENIANCIFYRNSYNGNNPGSNYTSVGSDIGNLSILNLQYSLTQSTLPCTAGCLPAGTNPLFVNAANPAGSDGIFGTTDDGLKLLSGSQAINTGSNAALPAGDTTDITGAVRVQGGTVDMGAYEGAVAPPVVTPTPFNCNPGNPTYVIGFKNGTNCTVSPYSIYTMSLSGTISTTPLFTTADTTELNGIGMNATDRKGYCLYYRRDNNITPNSCINDTIKLLRFGANGATEILGYIPQPAGYIVNTALGTVDASGNYLFGAFINGQLAVGRIANTQLLNAGTGPLAATYRTVVNNCGGRVFGDWAINPSDPSKLYTYGIFVNASNQVAGTVMTIDLATTTTNAVLNCVVATETTGVFFDAAQDNIGGIMFGSDGNMYGVNQNTRRYYRINPTTGSITLVSTIPANGSGTPTSSPMRLDLASCVSDMAAAPGFVQLSVAPAGNSGATVSWQAGGAATGSVFELERSYDGYSFVTLATEKAKLSFITSATTDIQTGTTNYYRVKQTSGTGLVTYSPVSKFLTTSTIKNKMMLYENLVTGSIVKGKLSLYKTANVVFTIFNAAGTKVFSRSAVMNAGASGFSHNIAPLAKGVYLLQAVIDNERLNQKFVVQ